MKLLKQSLLGVGITISPKEAILAYIQSFLSSTVKDLRPKTCLTIVTPNPEQIMLARDNHEFQTILNTADIALPDGAGVVWAMEKVLSTKYQVPSFQRISGIDFMEELCVMASENDWPVAFIGGRDGVAGKALTALQKRHPGLKGFSDDGPEIEDQNVNIKNQNSFFEALIKRIEEENIRFVFVGLGAPKQEYFINNFQLKISNSKLCQSVVMMSVGGSFDVLAGKIPRAPKSVQHSGFEWLWRLFHEPWRMRRQLSLFKFIILVFMQKRS